MVPGARRLFGGSLIARLPEGMQSLALLLLFVQAYDSYAVAGALVALFALASAGLTPFVARVVRRWGPGHVVMWCAATQCGALLALVAVLWLGLPAWVAAALVCVGGVAYPPVAACARAAWRTAAPDHRVRESGYLFDAVSQELIWLAGPALVTVCLFLAGPDLAVVLAALLVLTGGGYFAASPLLAAARTAPSNTSSARLPRRVWVLIGGCGITGLGFGATEVGVPALAEALHAPRTAGALLAAMSCGSLIGGLLYGSRHWRASVAMRHAVSALTLGAFTFALVGASTLPLTVALAFVAGLPWSPLLASQYASFAEAAPAEKTVAAFTWSSTAVVIGLALGAAAAGFVVEHGSTDAVFVLASGAYILAGLIFISLRAPRPRTVLTR